MRTAKTRPATGDRPRRTGRDPQRTRGHLLTASAEIFNRDGYYGTDTNRLAAAAGYAPATFYKHFTDKRDIFLQTYDQWVAREWQAIERLVTAPEDPARLIERIVDTVMAHHRRWARFRVSLVALATTDPEAAAFRIARRRTQIELFGEVLGRLGGPPTSRARTLSILLTFERLCDAVATGEARALGVSRADAAGELRALLASVTNATP